MGWTVLKCTVGSKIYWIGLQIRETHLSLQGRMIPSTQNVVFDNEGNALPTLDNPYALTFDPSYVYGPNQGIRLFFGIRYSLNKP